LTDEESDWLLEMTAYAAEVDSSEPGKLAWHAFCTDQYSAYD